MKFSGYTDGNDYHVVTLLSFLLDSRTWECGTQREWRWGWLYTWYDGPIWELNLGRVWLSLHP